MARDSARPLLLSTCLFALPALGACASSAGDAPSAAPTGATVSESGESSGSGQSVVIQRVRASTSAHHRRPGAPARTHSARGPQPERPGEGAAPGGAFAQAFVDAHNDVRARVPGAGQALAPLRWSPKLAAQAQQWADRCEFEHSDAGYGENLAARTSSGSPESVTGSWALEVEHYDHRSDRCAAGEVCGHYTQVVWRGSTQLGCAVSTCESDSPFGGGSWELWVCNYDPPGNWVGQKPY